MCDSIGDIPIQGKEHKSWIVGENHGAARADRGRD
jgi:hypothetical protein